MKWDTILVMVLVFGLGVASGGLMSGGQWAKKLDAARAQHIEELARLEDRLGQATGTLKAVESGRAIEREAFATANAEWSKTREVCDTFSRENRQRIAAGETRAQKDAEHWHQRFLKQVEENSRLVAALRGAQ